EDVDPRLCGLDRDRVLVRIGPRGARRHQARNDARRIGLGIAQPVEGVDDVVGGQLSPAWKVTPLRSINVMVLRSVLWSQLSASMGLTLRAMELAQLSSTYVVSVSCTVQSPRPLPGEW